MEATVTFNGPIDVEKDDGITVRLNLNGQRVRIVSEEGNIYWCEPVGFPWKGKFSINRDFLSLLESPKTLSEKYKGFEKKPRPRRLIRRRSLKRPK